MQLGNTLARNVLMRFLLAFLPVLTFSQEPVPIFGTTVVIPSGLRGEIYHISSRTSSLSELARYKPVGAVYTTALNIPPQDFEFGFPGVTSRFEWFAIDYSGKFWIEKPGVYRFRLVSDDGAMLYIDGQLIADNDGIHSTMVRLASIRLAGGMHAIRVPYFQGPGDTVALSLEVAGPGEEARVFSTDEFKPTANPEKWRFPAEPPAPGVDPDLSRVHAERIGGSENGRRVKRPRVTKK